MPYLITSIVSLRSSGACADKIEDKNHKTIKPGVSGLWQVSGRNNTTYEERVNFDIFYIKNRSFLLDVKIFFKTFVAIFSRNGAY